MGIEDRPYAGTWRLNNMRLVQHSPDALVYLNQDTSLPGCTKCDGRINFQKWITGVSTGCGVEPGGADATINMTIPHEFGSTVLADGNSALHPGLEVTVYKKGYFPYEGLYEEAEVMGAGDLDVGIVTGISADNLDFKPNDVLIGPGTRNQGVTEIPPHLMENACVTVAGMQVVRDFWAQDGATVTMSVSNTGGYQPLGKGNKHADDSQHAKATATDIEIVRNGKRLTNQQVYAGYLKLIKAGKLPPGGLGYYGANRDGGQNVHYDMRGYHKAKGDAGARWYPKVNGQKSRVLPFNPATVPDVPRVGDSVRSVRSIIGGLGEVKDIGLGLRDILPPDSSHTSPVDEYKANTPVYPYYHVFHGVVTRVAQSYGPGTYTVTLTCSSMLHFWEHQNVVINAQVAGSRGPRNTHQKSSLVGNKYANMTPYSIIYSLYYEEVGAPAADSFTVGQKTNRDSDSSAVNDSMYHLNTLYWEKRHTQRMYGLRMHGVSGEMWSAAQQAVIAKLDRKGLKNLGTKTYKEQQRKTNDPFKHDPARQRRKKNSKGELTKGTSTLFSTAQGMNTADQLAFSFDLGQFGDVQAFDSQYMGKLDIATQVTAACGYEFYQDVDGDLVFKPPYYNLNTKPSKVYIIEDVDIINMGVSEGEPAATYAVVTGTNHKNLKGMDHTFIQPKVIYVDYRLVAQFGWIETSKEVDHIEKPDSLWLYAVNLLTEMNKGLHTADVSIPLRPEMRPGFPVYIRHLDCYYYCTSLNHNTSFGGQCTTSLTLTAKRAKFYPPGDRHKKGIDAIDLSNMYLPSRPLNVLDAAGHTKLAGFPNVVMAIDPDLLNPLFAAGGADTLKVTDPNFLRDLVRRGRSLGVLSPAWDGGNPKKMWETGPWKFTSGNTTHKVTMKGLSSDKKKFASAQQGYLKGKGIQAAPNEALHQSLQKEAGVLLALITEVQQHFMAAHPDLPEPGSTAALLDLLRDRKVGLNNASMPGHYRYYSCSHPDPVHQGQLQISSDANGFKVGPREKLDVPITTTGFVKHPARLSSGYAPEAELGNIQVTAGIRIKQPKGGSPKVVPTSHIMSASLSTATHTYTNATSTTKKVTPGTTPGIDELRLLLSRKLRADIKATAATATAATTVASLLEVPYENLRKTMEGVTGTPLTPFAKFKLANGKTFKPELASTITVGGYVGSAEPSQKAEAIAAYMGRTLAGSQIKALNALKKAAMPTANPYTEQQSTASEPSPHTQQQSTTKQSTEALAAQKKALRVAQKKEKALMAALGGTGRGHSSRRGGKKRTRNIPGSPLVLPVSDAEGYTHFGGFQYGRGLDIQPGGTFEQLARQDPLKSANYKDIAEAVSRLTVKDGKLILGTGNKAKYLQLAARLATNAGVDLGLGFEYTPGTIKNLSADEQGMFSLAFRNWIANSFNSEHKVVAANAAVNLATLQHHITGNTCNCKGAEANLELQAFNTENYVGVDEGQEGIVTWLKGQMETEGKSWAANQQALRGKLVDPRHTSITERAENFVEGLRSGAASSISNLGTQAQDVGIGEDSDG